MVAVSQDASVQGGIAARGTQPDSIKYPRHSSTSSRSDVFIDNTLLNYWQEVYDSVNYENRHLIDPGLEWDEAEERHVLRKTDMHATLFALIAFICLNIDRTNIKTAITGSLFADVGIGTNDYNLGTTLNLFCFLAAELPSNLISKRIGSDRFIPVQMVLWSIAVILQSRIASRNTFLCMRALIGALEGGFIPVMGLWLSYFYTGSELALRLGIFYIANPLVQALTSLMAFAIFHLENVGGLAGWQWIFILEGSMTLLVGLMAFFIMPATPSETKTWLRPKGWYSDRQEKIMINRILRDDPAKGAMNNRQHLSLKNLWLCTMNVNMWPTYLVRVFGDVSTAAIGLYQPIILKNVGFTTFQANLLMVPNQILSIVTLVSTAWLTSRYKRYALFMLLTPLWVLPCLIALTLQPDLLKHKLESFWILLIALGGPSVTPMSVSWCSHNSGDVTMRAVSGALVNMFSQIGGMIAANVFHSETNNLIDELQHGFARLIGISALSVLVIISSHFWYQQKNAQRDRIWSSMTHGEQTTYVRETQDEGNKRLDFRFMS